MNDQTDLLIARLHAEEDEIRCSAGQTSLQVGLASDLFGLCIIVIERLHRVLEQCPLNLETHIIYHVLQKKKNVSMLSCSH